MITGHIKKKHLILFTYFNTLFYIKQAKYGEHPGLLINVVFSSDTVIDSYVTVINERDKYVKTYANKIPVTKFTFMAAV